MISRLVLVGVVGALGISVPTWPEVREWMGAVHSWTAWQLAAWDACSRREVDSIAMVPTPRPLPAEIGLAAATDARAIRPAPLPAFEPIVVDRARMGPGVRIESQGRRARHRFGRRGCEFGAEIAETRPSDASRKDSNEARRRDDLSRPLVADALELKLMAALVQAAESADAPAFPITTPVAEGRCRVPASPLACVFTRSSSATRPAASDRAIASASSPGPAGTTLPSVGRRSLNDTMPGTGPKLDCFAEPFDQPAPAVAVATSSRPAFDLIDPGTEPGAGLAEELNSASHGLAVELLAPILDHRDPPEPSPRSAPIAHPAAPVREVPRPVPAPHVAQALRLTGEAVHAWMNVLTGPAIVQVSVR